MRYRGYILTIPLIQNGNRVKLKDIRNAVINRFDYVVFQVEKGEETGYKHVQMYLENEDQVKFDTLKKLFPKAHIEARLGSKKQAFTYCTKFETRLHGPFEYGERPEFLTSAEKRRSIKEAFIRAVSEGAEDRELLLSFPTIFSKKYDEEIRSVLGVHLHLENRDVNVVYITGPTRSGKTSYVRRKYPPEDIYVVSDYEKGPFDSYKGQKVIIFEEYRSNFPLSVFLQMLDRYPFELPCRYQNRQAMYTQVYIISNWDLRSQYISVDINDKQAFISRINYVIEITKETIFMEAFENGKFKSKKQMVNPISDSFKNYQFHEESPLPLYFEEC